MMKLTIPIDVPPQGRPRFTRAGIAYDPPKSRKFKAALAMIILSECRTQEPMSGALRVTIQVRRAGFKKGATSRKFGDIDNLAKTILDAITMSGVVWRDDSQIVDLHIKKGTADEPSIEIEIEEATANEDVSRFFNRCREENIDNDKD